MSHWNWIHRLFAHKSRVPVVKRKPKTRTSFRPMLEALEDRLAPAALTVNSLADNTTDTSQLTLREAIALVNGAGNPGRWDSRACPLAGRRRSPAPSAARTPSSSTRAWPARRST